MINKTLIVPDVHGRSFWEEPVEKELENIDKVIFLGDYLDPYPQEGITPEEAIEEFEKILNLKKNYPDKITLLLGNHDYHYCNHDITPCSRYDHYNSHEIEEIFRSNLDLFQLFYKEEKYLFSHAGIMKSWMEKYCNCSSIDELLKNESKAYSSLWVIPRIRGGIEWFGSCLWNDVRDFKNEIPGTFQIFGHTQLKKEFIGPIPGAVEEFACLDCRKCFILDVLEETIKEYGGKE